MALIIGTGGNDSLTGTAGNDVLVGDPQRQGGIVLVSSTEGGAAGDSNSLSPRFSPDGTKVVFVSQSGNFTGDGISGDYQIYVKDLQTGEITRVSESASGVRGFRSSDIGDFTPDGTKVIFLSAASNLVAGDTNGKADLFMKDLATGEVTLLTTNSAGQQTNNDSLFFDVSADGTKIVFESDASNLVAGDTNGYTDIFVKDLTTGVVTRVSTSASGAEGDLFSRDPKFSPDGNSVLFESFASNFVAGETPGDDIFIKNLTTGAITKISQSAAGVPGDGQSSDAQFSPDGTKVVFQSTSTNLIAGQITTGNTLLFMKDLTTGLVTLLSSNSAGVALTGTSSAGSFSPDGSQFAFSVTLSNGSTQGFVKDLDTSELFVLPGNPTYVTEFSSNGGLGYYTYVGGIAQSYVGYTQDLGSGADALNGGQGNDYASYTTALQSVKVNRTDASGLSNLGDALGDTYVSIEGFYLSDFADTYIGNSGDDEVFGEKGADTLNGGGGDDFIEGGEGADTLNGGTHDVDGDWLSYAYSAAGVSIVLNASGIAATVSGGDAAGDVAINFENLVGSSSADNLSGNSDNNIINGNGGNDIINGGGGADTIVFNTGLLAGNVNGGTGTDRLLVINGALPTGFNLAAAGLETAQWQQTDTGGNNWSTIVSNYNSSWGITDSLTTYDDNRTRSVVYDFAGQNWASLTEDFNAANQRTGYQYNYDDGRISQTTLDLTGAATYWSALVENYNAGGQRTDYQYNHDDGRISHTTVDLSGAATYWSSLLQNYNASGQRTDYQYTHDNGVISHTTLDLTGAATYWSSLLQNYNAAGQRTDYQYTHDDGRISHTTLDLTGAATYWSVLSQNYNASGQRTDYQYTHDDGRISHTTLDLTGAATYWSTLEQRYNAAGQRDGFIYSWDNGRVSATTIDAVDSFAWDTLQENYNAAGTRTDYIYFNDDSSRQEVTIDVGNQYSWTTQTINYDTAGNVIDIIYA